MKIIDWKEEAQKQASAAGILKIKLAFRLDDINTRLIALKKDIAVELDPNILYCTLNRISILEEEKRWLESILNSKGDDE